MVNVSILNTPYLIITFQDIQSEMEEKEIEAWHDIIRVLAHEMLNSFTPVASLAATIKTMTEDEKGQLLNTQQIENETIEDINLGAATIQKRSEGLLDFVADYRMLSNLPTPQLAAVNLKDFINNIERLMKAILEQEGIELRIGTIPSRATLALDEKLIEQVFINLIGNSIHALKNRPNPYVSIECTINDINTTLSITDNGKGIEPEIMSNIFIPFFTTRKNGSGIGLSLSKDIIKQHKGQLLVRSEVDEYTTFLMVFGNDVR